MASQNHSPLPWLQPVQSSAVSIIIKIRVQPNASRSQVAGLFGDRLKIRIAAPPVDGAANAELISFLKKTLSVSTTSLTLIRGDTSRNKDVLCNGLTPEEVQKKLLP